MYGVDISARLQVYVSCCNSLTACANYFIIELHCKNASEMSLSKETGDAEANLNLVDESGKSISVTTI